MYFGISRGSIDQNSTVTQPSPSSLFSVYSIRQIFSFGALSITFAVQVSPSSPTNSTRPVRNPDSVKGLRSLSSRKGSYFAWLMIMSSFRQSDFCIYLSRRKYFEGYSSQTLCYLPTLSTKPMLCTSTVPQRVEPSMFHALAAIADTNGNDSLEL